MATKQVNKFKTVECAECSGTGKQPAVEAVGELKVEREKLHLSLKAVAQAIGISVSHLSDIERGNRRLTLPAAVKYAEALYVARKVMDDQLNGK